MEKIEAKMINSTDVNLQIHELVKPAFDSYSVQQEKYCERINKREITVEFLQQIARSNPISVIKKINKPTKVKLKNPTDTYSFEIIAGFEIAYLYFHRAFEFDFLILIHNDMNDEKIETLAWAEAHKNLLNVSVSLENIEVIFSHSKRKTPQMIAKKLFGKSINVGVFSRVSGFSQSQIRNRTAKYKAHRKRYAQKKSDKNKEGTVEKNSDKFDRLSANVSSDTNENEAMVAFDFNSKEIKNDD